MTWIAVVAVVIAAWVGLSVAVAVLFGQAVRIAERRQPRKPAARRARRSTALGRVVELATGAIPVIRPALAAVTGAIPIIRPRLD